MSRMMNTFLLAGMSAMFPACAYEANEAIADEDEFNEQQSDDAIGQIEPGQGSSMTPTAELAAQCHVGEFCVWEHSPFMGHFASFRSGASDLRKAIGGFVFNNLITDVWNRTGVEWCLYDGANCTNARWRIRPGFQGFLGDFNDVTSSLKRCSSSTCP